MPIAIILAADEDAKERAKREGFKEETFLVKRVSCLSSEKWKEEKNVRELGRVYQFAVFDFWGMMPD